MPGLPAGLRLRHPALAWMLAVSAISLIGIPPLVGFFGKLALFSSAIEAGQTFLVIIAAVNSAISAFYYLQLVAVPMLGQPNARTEAVQLVPSRWPRSTGLGTWAGSAYAIGACEHARATCSR